MLILMNEAQIRKTVETEPYIEKNGHASRSLWVVFTCKGRILVRTTPDGIRSVGFGSDQVGDFPHVSGPIWDVMVQRGLSIITDEVMGVGPWVEDDISFIGSIDEVGLPAVKIVGVIEIPDGYELDIAPHAGTDAEMVDPNVWLKTEELPIDARSHEVIHSLSLLLQDPSLESSVVTWKKIPGYAQYLAGSDGSIKNLKTDHISKGGDAGRYLKVSVYPDGKDKPHLEYLHILICKAYHGIPRESQVVLHKNNIRKDCRPSNLQLGTQSENVKDAYDDGLIKGKGADYSEESIFGLFKSKPKDPPIVQTAPRPPSLFEPSGVLNQTRDKSSMPVYAELFKELLSEMGDVKEYKYPLDARKYVDIFELYDQYQTSMMKMLETYVPLYNERLKFRHTFGTGLDKLVTKEFDHSEGEVKDISVIVDYFKSHESKQPVFLLDIFKSKRIIPSGSDSLYDIRLTDDVLDMFINQRGPVIGKDLGVIISKGSITKLMRSNAIQKINKAISAFNEYAVKYEYLEGWDDPPFRAVTEVADFIGGRRIMEVDAHSFYDKDDITQLLGLESGGFASAYDVVLYQYLKDSIACISQINKGT